MLKKVLKSKLIVVIAVCGILGPIIISVLYSVGNVKPIFTTMWNASDLLQYYGTLLGALATIFAVYKTIEFTNELSFKERIWTSDHEYRKLGTEACFKLLDTSGFSSFIYYEEKILRPSNECDLLNETVDFEKLLNERINKVKLVFPNLQNKTLNYLENYASWYVGEIRKFITKFSDDTSEISDQNIFEYIRKVRIEHDERYSKVRDVIYGILLNYSLYESYNDQEI